MAFLKGTYSEYIRCAINDCRLTPANEHEIVEEMSRLICDSVRSSLKSKVDNVLATLVQNLYNRDNKALKRDLAKIMVLDGAADATEQERFRLLQCLYGSLNILLNDDISPLINSISYDIAFEDRYEAGEEELPFS